MSSWGRADELQSILWIVAPSRVDLGFYIGTLFWALPESLCRMHVVLASRNVSCSADAPRVNPTGPSTQL